MPRSITRLQSKILLILEEAGEENLPTLLNELSRPQIQPVLLNLEIDLEIFGRELLELWRYGAIDIAATGQRQTDESCLDWLSESLTLDERLDRWTWCEESAYRPVVSITELGKKLLFA